MNLLPAIDLSGGQCVRLRQGKKENKTVYSDDPISVARKWEELGGDWLHVVDLDRTIDGRSENLPVIAAIIKSVSIPVELGGGLRDYDSVDEAFKTGVERVVIGTRALVEPEFLSALVKKYGAERIVAGIDAKNGRVAVKGWTEVTGETSVDTAFRMREAGAVRVVYTDISRDGMLEGINLDANRELADKTGLKIIVSGGVAGIGDLRRVLDLNHPDIDGLIIGKALYEGTFDLSEAAALVKSYSS